MHLAAHPVKKRLLWILERTKKAGIMLAKISLCEKHNKKLHQLPCFA